MTDIKARLEAIPKAIPEKITDVYWAGSAICFPFPSENWKEYAEFLLHAPTDIAALLNKVEQLEAVVEAAKKAKVFYETEDATSDPTCTCDLVQHVLTEALAKYEKANLDGS